jgi:transcriptional regulator with XRE-family HTH domain
MERLAEALRLLRVFHDLNQAEASETLRISAPYLSQLESGRKTASMDVIGKYADAFAVPVSSILLLAERIGTGDFSNLDRDQLVARKILRILDWLQDTQDDAKLKKPVVRELARHQSKRQHKAS